MRTLSIFAFSRYDELRLALLCKWTPSIEAEPFAKIAFRSLCDLTPAQTQLSALFNMIAVAPSMSWRAISTRSSTNSSLQHPWPSIPRRR